MTESKKHTQLDLTDDAPDLSSPEWQEKFATAKVQQGRLKAGGDEGEHDHSPQLGGE